MESTETNTIFSQIYEIVIEKSKMLNRTIIIGVSGIPGSGKSTFSYELKNHLSQSNNLIKVIPFDGFHKYKSELTEDQMEYRGRMDTFDINKFQNKIKALKEFYFSKNDKNKNEDTYTQIHSIRNDNNELNITNININTSTNTNTYTSTKLLSNGNRNDDLKQNSIFFPSFNHSVGDPIENDIEIDKENTIIILEGLYLFCQDLGCLDFFDIKIFLQTDLSESMLRVAKRNFEAGISKSYEESLIRTNSNDKANAQYVLNSLTKENSAEIIYINYIK
jgi:pantothenate kinase